MAQNVIKTSSATSCISPCRTYWRKNKLGTYYYCFQYFNLWKVENEVNKWNPALVWENFFEELEPQIDFIIAHFFLTDICSVGF